MTTPNVFKDKDRCARDCRTTWAIEHGGALPGGPFPGGYASAGDVRRCEHGKLWIYDEHENRRQVAPSMNYWRRLNWFWYPIVSWRARRKLKQFTISVCEDPDCGRS